MDENTDNKLHRRRLILRTGALGVTGLGAAACVPAQPVYVQQPPVVVRGTGITDADPNDGPGNGRGGYRAPVRGTGITDADPSDGPGNGRGGYRGAPAVGYRTGITDSDPNDGPGRGRGGYRGGYRTGVTDSDPNDGAGRGRRGY